jgi:hypothetical protein
MNTWMQFILWGWRETKKPKEIILHWCQAARNSAFSYLFRQKKPLLKKIIKRGLPNWIKLFLSPFGNFQFKIQIENLIATQPTITHSPLVFMQNSCISLCTKRQNKDVNNSVNLKFSSFSFVEDTKPFSSSFFESNFVWCTTREF